MIRAVATPQTAAQSPVARVAARTSIWPGMYQIREESAPKTAAPAINQNRIWKA